LLKKLEPILQSYIEENSISLVVDKKYILGWGGQSNITKVIVDQLNKDLPSLNLK
jgi:Skp family chaperone for outer membrane proteins